MSIDPDAPWFNRPRKYDKVLQKYRRLFWDELTPEAQLLELQYHMEMSVDIINGILEGSKDE